jgi:DNA-binding beta-propeller fold protein YncE
MRPNSHGLIVAAMFLLLLSNIYAAAGANPPSGTTPRYIFDAAWPQKPDGFKWGQMPGVTVDAQDQVYIFTRSQPAVQVYQADGKFLRSWDMEDSAGAHFIRVGPDGNVWTADIKNHVVCKYSPKGKLLLTLGEAGHAGTDQGHFDKPTDIAVLPTGDIFVTDGYGNRRVIHFDAAGKYINQWGEAGSKPGQFALPHSIVADSKRRLYVADRENARIQVFDTTGKLLAVWADLVTPWGLWLTKNDEIWVSGSSPVRKDVPDKAGEWIVTPPADQVVMKLSQKGEVLLRLPLQKTTVPPGKPGELDWVHGIAFDSEGNLYLTDIQGKRAQKFLRQS